MTMQSGKLGKAALAANVDVDLYTVPAGACATVDINLCNRTAGDITARIAVRNGALTDADYIEYDALVPAKGRLLNAGVIVSAGEVVTIRAAAVGISARVQGYEEAA